MPNYKNNAEINNLIYQHVNQLVINKYTNDTWDCDYLNKIDRMSEAKKVTSLYFKKNDFNSIGGIRNEDAFIDYTAKQIDKLIPLFCFMHTNKGLSERYNSILTRRIFNSHDKNYFPCTENLLYVYEHDFSKEKEYIKKTKVTINQLSFLKKLSDEQGFVIINKEYMTLENAKNLIAYLKGNLEHEPRLFNFFMITV